MRRTITLGITLGALAFAACGDDSNDGASADTADTAVETGPGEEVVEETTEPEVEVDTTPEFDPQANIYRIDPLTTPEITQVMLEHLTSEDHTLVGEFARVRSCTPDRERGEEIPIDFGGFQLTVTACVPESKALPGDDGTYLHILPPESGSEDDGRFAEVMMYHHMQVVHDYFKDVHGLTDRDHPLDAVTNVQAHVDLCDQWAMIANAAFIPDGAIEQLGFDLDLGLNGDAIVFSGTTNKNFAFDGNVIYHEYVHAILGATRLNTAFIDDQGINNLPGALNEAYADYFAGTITDQSAVGNYALNDIEGISICGFQLGGGGSAGRDMEVDKTCPYDLTAEVHADSEIFSSALWQIREELGQTDADRVILAAVLTLTNTSGFTVAAEATIDQAQEQLGDEARATVESAFTERGLIDCPRVLPVERVGERGLPVTLETPQAFSPNPFPGYAPGYMQYSFEVPEETSTVTLSFEIAAGGGLGGLLGGGGGGDPELEAVFKVGEEPVRYTMGIGIGSGSHDGTLILPIESNEVVITGTEEEPLATGVWTFAIHNSGGSASLSKIEVAFE